MLFRSGGIEIAIDGSAASATSVQINYNTAAVAVGDIARVGAGLMTAASASAEGGANVDYARALGVVTVSNASGKIAVSGVVQNCNFVSGGLTLGGPAFLSPDTAGKLTATAPTAEGDVIAEVGIIVKINSIVGGAGAADVLWQPKSIVVI